jgi:hypothetical protein
MGNMFGQPVNAVGRRPAKVACDDTDVGIRKGKRLP